MIILIQDMLSKLIFNIHENYMKLKMKNWKFKELVCDLNDKKDDIVHFRTLKQAPNFVLVLQKKHRVIKFNLEAWLKPCIARNTKLRKYATNDFGKNVFKLMINSVFGKNMENLQKHRNIELLTNEKIRDCLVSELNYHTPEWFSKIY